MDILYWKNKNQSVRFEETTKQFFRKYLYRLRLDVPGGRIIYDNKDYALALEERKRFRQVNPGGYWGRPSMQNLDRIDIKLLHLICDIKDSNPNARIRIEEPEMQFYAETEAELKSIADQLGPQYQHIVLAVSGPSSNTKHLLENGVIIRKKEIGYNYKIVLRDGRCDAKTKLQILNYLESLGLEEARVSAGVKNMLMSNYNGFWSIWFYANDTKITTFLELIHPGCILNIHPVVVA